MIIKAAFFLAVRITSAASPEVRLIRQTVCEWFADERIEKMIDDKANDPAPLDAELAELSIELIAPPAINRKKA